MSTLSVIMPVLNEGASLEATLRALAPLRAAGVELIVVDGGSSDESIAIAAPLADRVTPSAGGRAIQMNTGAVQAHGEVLLFLHADTTLPADADTLVRRAIAAGRCWGRFDVRISGRSRMLPLIAWCMNLRSRLTGIATGDQAIFVTRAVFLAAGGFTVQALMEDVEFCRRMKAHGRPACLRARVTTSGRRWETQGVLRTMVLMWHLRARYFFGADPERLAQAYRHVRRPS